MSSYRNNFAILFNDEVRRRNRTWHHRAAIAVVAALGKFKGLWNTYLKQC